MTETIRALTRLSNTKDGNPRWQVTVSDDATGRERTFETPPDSTIGYDIHAGLLDQPWPIK